MNEQEDNTASAGALERSTITVDHATIAKLSLRELRCLREGVNTLMCVCTGTLNEPRFINEKTRVYNAAGEQLDIIFEWLAELHEAILNAARQSKPSDPKAVEERAWCILGALADYADRLEDVGVAAAHALDDLRSAEFNAAHASRQVGRAA